MGLVVVTHPEVAVNNREYKGCEMNPSNHKWYGEDLKEYLVELGLNESDKRFCNVGFVHRLGAHVALTSYTASTSTVIL